MKPWERYAAQGASAAPVQATPKPWERYQAVEPVPTTPEPVALEPVAPAAQPTVAQTYAAQPNYEAMAADMPIRDAARAQGEQDAGAVVDAQVQQVAAADESAMPELQSEFAWLSNPFKSSDPQVQEIIKRMTKLWVDPDMPPADKLEQLRALKRRAGMVLESTRTGARAATEAGEAELQEKALRMPYLAAKGGLSGLTMGASDVALNKVEEALGGRVQAQGLDEAAMQSLAQLGGGALTGGVITKGFAGQSFRYLPKAEAAKALGGVSGMLTKMGYTGLKHYAATRLATNTLMNGARQITGVISGDVKAEDAAGNMAQSVGGTIAGMVAELGVPGGVGNAAAQVATDLVYDFSTDLLRGRIADTSAKGVWTWFIENELPQLVNSVVFAGMDLADPNFKQQQKLLKDEFKARWQGKIKEAPFAPTPKEGGSMPPPTEAEARETDVQAKRILRGEERAVKDEIKRQNVEREMAFQQGKKESKAAVAANTEFSQELENRALKTMKEWQRSANTEARRDAAREERQMRDVETGELYRRLPDGTYEKAAAPKTEIAVPESRVTAQDGESLVVMAKYIEQPGILGGPSMTADDAIKTVARIPSEERARLAQAIESRDDAMIDAIRDKYRPAAESRVLNKTGDIVVDEATGLMIQKLDDGTWRATELRPRPEIEAPPIVAAKQPVRKAPSRIPLPGESRDPTPQEQAEIQAYADAEIRGEPIPLERMTAIPPPPDEAPAAKQDTKIVKNEDGSEYEITGYRADGTEKRRSIKTRRFSTDYGRTYHEGYRLGEELPKNSDGEYDTSGIDVIAWEGKETPGAILVVDLIGGKNGVVLRWIQPGEPPAAKPKVPLSEQPLSEPAKQGVEKEIAAEAQALRQEGEEQLRKRAATVVLGNEDYDPTSKLPFSQRVKQGVESIGKNIKRLAEVYMSDEFGVTGERKDELRKTLRDYKNTATSLTHRAQGNRALIAAAREELIMKSGKDKAFVLSRMDDVLTGGMTIGEFKATMNVGDNNALVKELQRAVDERAARTAKTSDIMDKGTPEQQTAAKKFRENIDTYLTQFYRIHLQGEDFVPNQNDVRAARAFLADKMSAEIQGIGADLSKVSKETGATIAELQDVLTTRGSDPVAFARRAFPDQPGRREATAELLTSLRDRYDKTEGMISKFQDTPYGIIAFADAGRVASATKQAVDIMLGRQIDAKEVNPFLKRHLKDPEVQRLYGIVTNPEDKIAMTAYLQDMIYERVKLIDDIYAGGRGQWWADPVDITKEQQRVLTHTVPNNPTKYGNLAGKKVQKAIHDILTGGDKRSLGAEAWDVGVGYTRLKQLAFSLPTYERNFISNLLRFAMQNGDVYNEPVLGSARMAADYSGKLITQGANAGASDKRLSFTREQIEALKFMAKYVKSSIEVKARKGEGRIAAQRAKAELYKELELLAKLGVFSAKTNPIANAIAIGDEGTMQKMQQLFTSNGFKQAMASKSPADIVKALAKAPSKIVSATGGIYAWSDFVHKYGSFRMQVAMGKTPEQAARHVIESYPNSELVSRAGRVLNKVPVVNDFFAYKESAFKIQAIQTLRALQEMGKANPDYRRIAGYMTGLGSLAVGTTAGYQVASNAVSWLHEKSSEIASALMGEDGEVTSAPASAQQLEAARTFFPHYYFPKPALMWTSTDKDGKKRTHTIMLSNTDGSPVMEDVSGWMQSASHRNHAGLTQVVKDNVGMSMLTDELSTIAFGNEYREGLRDIWDSESQTRTEKLLDLAIDGGLRLLAPIPTRWLDKLDRAKSYRAQLKSKEITQEEYDARVADLQLTELLPFRVYSYDKEQVENLVGKAFRKKMDLYEKDVRRPISRVMRQADQSAISQSEAGVGAPVPLARDADVKRAQQSKAIGDDLVREMQLMVRDAKTAYSGMLEDADIYRMLKGLNMSEKMINAVMDTNQGGYEHVPASGVLPQNL